MVCIIIVILLIRIYFLVKIDERISNDQATFVRKLKYLNIFTGVLIVVISAVYISVFVAYEVDENY